MVLAYLGRRCRSRCVGSTRPIWVDDVGDNAWVVLARFGASEVGGGASEVDGGASEVDEGFPLIV